MSEAWPEAGAPKASLSTRSSWFLTLLDIYHHVSLLQERILIQAVVLCSSRHRLHPDVVQLVTFVELDSYLAQVQRQAFALLDYLLLLDLALSAEEILVGLLKLRRICPEVPLVYRTSGVVQDELGSIVVV